MVEMDVQVERRTLDACNPMVFRSCASGLRMAYDPGQITEEQALRILEILAPGAPDALRVARSS